MGTLAIVDPVLTILADCCRIYSLAFWASLVDQNSIVINHLAIVYIFSLLCLWFRHSFAYERLTNSEKAQIPYLHYSGIVTIINCLCEVFLTFFYSVIIVMSCRWSVQKHLKLWVECNG